VTSYHHRLINLTDKRRKTRRWQSAGPALIVQAGGKKKKKTLYSNSYEASLLRLKDTSYQELHPYSISRDEQIFQKSLSNLNILGSRKVA